MHYHACCSCFPLLFLAVWHGDRVICILLSRRPLVSHPHLGMTGLSVQFIRASACAGMGPEDAELCNGKDAVCMGVSSVQRVQRHHSSYTHDHQDTGIMRLGVRQASQASFRRHVFTDATIEVDGRVWAVHRATLACASPVFESMFSSNMLEGERPEAIEAVSAVHIHNRNPYRKILRTVYASDPNA